VREDLIQPALRRARLHIRLTHPKSRSLVEDPSQFVAGMMATTL
jgi:hypothetical protein